MMASARKPSAWLIGRRQRDYKRKNGQPVTPPKLSETGPWFKGLAKLCNQASRRKPSGETRRSRFRFRREQDFFHELERHFFAPTNFADLFRQDEIDLASADLFIQMHRIDQFGELSFGKLYAGWQTCCPEH